MIALRVAVSCGLIMAMPVVAPVGAGELDDPDKPLEVVFRYVAAVCQPHASCYLAVEGKPPSQALVKRLRELPNTRPLTGTERARRRKGDPALLISLSRVTPLPDGTARVDERTTMGDREFSSCLYILSRGRDAWQIDQRRSMCDLD